MRKILQWINLRNKGMRAAAAVLLGGTFALGAGTADAQVVGPFPTEIWGEDADDGYVGDHATYGGDSGYNEDNEGFTPERELVFSNPDGVHLLGGAGGDGGAGSETNGNNTLGGNGGNGGFAILTRTDFYDLGITGWENDYAENSNFAYLDPDVHVGSGLAITIKNGLLIEGGIGGLDGIDGTYSNGGSGGIGGSAGIIASSLSTGGNVEIRAGINTYDILSGSPATIGGNALILVDNFDAHGSVNVIGNDYYYSGYDAPAHYDGLAKSILHVYDTMTVRELNVEREYDSADDIYASNVDVSIRKLDVNGKSTTINSIGSSTDIDGDFDATRKDFYIAYAHLAGGGELIINDFGEDGGNPRPGMFLDSTADPSMEINVLDVSGTGYLQTNFRQKASINEMHVLENANLIFMLPETFRLSVLSENQYTTQLVTVNELKIGSNNNLVFPNTWFTLDTRADAWGNRPHLGPGDEIHLLHSATDIEGIRHLNDSSMTDSGHRTDIFTQDDNGDWRLISEYGAFDDETVDGTYARDIWARISVNPMASLSNARLASLGFANWGSDLITGQGMRAATATHLCIPCRTDQCTTIQKCRECARCAVVPFVVGQGGNSEYKTGGHSEISGGTVMGGVAWNKNCNNRHLLTIGIFGEGGWGNYHTKDAWLDADNQYTEKLTRGSGDTNYYGGGVLARLGWDCNPRCGAYVEGSFRAGKVDADYRSSDLWVNNAMSKYDFSGTYYGAHLGIGYGWSWNKSTYFEAYTKGIWNRMEGEDINIYFAQTHRQSFDDVDSIRLRVGGRLTQVMNRYLTPYVGVAWEHEFDGDANSYYQTDTGAGFSGSRFELDKRSFGGNSAVAEAGITLRPFGDTNFVVDAGAQGYFGLRQGGMANLGFKWEF